MEKFAYRGNGLFRCSPQNSFVSPSSSSSSSSPKAKVKDSDVDFRDVFGGPPRRRSSTHDWRFSFTEITDSSALRGDDELNSYRRARSGLGEKPVFGEEDVSRRRYPSNDFFDDIFRGDEALSSTPRKPDRDPFVSSPGSRVLSPAHPLPPRVEPSSSSLVPAPFSLPAKLAKGMDLPLNSNPHKSKVSTSNVIGYTHSSITSKSRFSCQPIQGQNESRHDGRPTYCPSPLSQEISCSGNESLKWTKSDKADTEGDSKKDSCHSEVSQNSSHFHFSIYKWASKGVPLMTPLRRGGRSRLKEKGKIERWSSSNGRVESDSTVNEASSAHMHEVGIHSVNSNKSPQDSVEQCQIMEEAVPATHKSKTLNSLQNAVDNVPGIIICDDKTEETISHSLPEISLYAKTGEDIFSFKQEASKPRLKTLRYLLSDSNDEQGNEKMAQEYKGKENMLKTARMSSVNVDAVKNGKKQGRDRIASNRAEGGNSTSQVPVANSKVNLGRYGLKGRVKDFVKIFNQETSSQPKVNVDTQSQSSRWKNTNTFKEGDEISFRRARTDDNASSPSLNTEKALSDASILVGENVKQMEKQKFGIKTANHKFSDTCNGWKNSPASCAGPEYSATTLGNMDKFFEENFLDNEQIISLDQNKPTQTGEDHDEIQVSDARIQQWSNGKEGNIRSLLSTLQYVLWPESGWKPVPLVDIIEGNAVKRAYQKALLCLHPDKLQQKGAASHQKYIAEKVFDILQEAWTHFNGLSSL